MPRIVGSFTDEWQRYFFEHSTVADAPVTAALLRDEFWAYYVDQNRGPLERVVAELEQKLLAAIREPFEELVFPNRAGPGERCLSPAEYKQLVLSWREHAKQ